MKFIGLVISAILGLMSVLFLHLAFFHEDIRPPASYRALLLGIVCLSSSVIICLLVCILDKIEKHKLHE